MRIKIGAKRIPRAKDSIDLSICYREHLISIKRGVQLFAILRDCELLPDNYRKWGGKRVPFLFERLDDLVPEMWRPVVWFDPDERREKVVLRNLDLYRSNIPKYWGHISRSGVGQVEMHVDVRYVIEARGVCKGEGAGRIECLISRLLSYGKTDFARVQYYSALERENSRRGKEPDTTFVSRELGECLPDLYNITVWGEPYIKFFGKQKLLEAPCYKVEELPSGLIWMQLSPEVYTEKGCWTALRYVREGVKAYLDNNAFRDPNLPQDHKFNVPQFDFSEIMKPLKVPKGDKR